MMEKTNVFVIGILVLAAALITGVVCAYVFGGFDLLYTAVIVTLVVVISVILILYIVFGAYYFVKQKDTVHPEDGMSLDSISEIDREMEKK